MTATSPSVLSINVVDILQFKPNHEADEMAAAQRTDPDIMLLYNAKVVTGVRPTWNEISGASPAAKAYIAEWKRMMKVIRAICN